MMTSINIESSVPVYEQIENHVQFAIASGELKGGDRITPVKALAEQLGVNFNTIPRRAFMICARILPPEPALAPKSV